METNLPISPIQFEIARDDKLTASLSVTCKFAPSTHEVGKPGRKEGDILLLEKSPGIYQAILSLGSAEKCSTETIRRAGGSLGRWLIDTGAEKVELDLDSLNALGINNSVGALLEGIRLGAYRFTRHKQQDEPQKLINVILRSSDHVINQAVLNRTEAITNSVILARNLAHEPANIINPVTLVEYARQVAINAGVNFRVLDENDLAKLGAGAILAVGQGSQTPPRLILLEYPGDQPETGTRPVIILGKAITFDTGGYSIKDTNNIVGMKYDKCGGINVLGIIQAAAALRIKTPLIGVISAAENMISSNAYRPDDIITTLSGKTVEIVSTDAEGRLVLADALTYIQQEFQPRAIIDLATLTGGVVVALGRVRAGFVSNNDELAQKLIEAGERTFERLWRLPLDEDYVNIMKGDDADLKNSGGREGHPVLGGAFLSEFVSKDIPWAHLDIAGVADTPKDLPYCPKGATGFGIRLLLDFLENYI